jgi:hypothetical protein
VKSSKIGAIFIVSAIALAGVGASYAMWTDTINAVGTVHTATFSVGWSVPDPREIHIHGDSYDICDVNVVTDPNSGDLQITIEDAYPSVTFEIPFDIHLTGQLWAILDGWTFSYTNFDPSWIVSITPCEGILVDSHQFDGMIVIHLDNNAQPGSTYTFTIHVGAHQYNECNPPLSGKTIELPPNPITAIFTWTVEPSYWSTALNGVPVGFSVSNSPPSYLGWCVDEDTYIVPGQVYTIKLLSSYDPTLSIDYPDWIGNYWYSWPCVNYIINHKGAATGAQIQSAIWYFLNNGYYGSDPVVLSLISNAELYGKSFYPSSGQNIAVICIGWPYGDWQHGYPVQKTFIEVDP